MRNREARHGKPFTAFGNDGPCKEKLEKCNMQCPNCFLNGHFHGRCGKPKAHEFLCLLKPSTSKEEEEERRECQNEDDYPETHECVLCGFWHTDLFEITSRKLRNSYEELMTDPEFLNAIHFQVNEGVLGEISQAVEEIYGNEKRLSLIHI